VGVNMRKKINNTLVYFIILAMTLIFVEGCDKKDNIVEINSQKQLQTLKYNDSRSEDKDKGLTKTVEINELKNEQLKVVIEDKGETLKNGVYGCISKKEGNYYIFINGVDYWYSNILFSVKDKILTIKYDTEYEKGLRIKHVFLIIPKNVEVFDKVELINNGSKEDFKILFQQ
jgi:hypothetical protein